VKLWIDLDNAPHVPFFGPLIREFETRGHSVLVTLRDFGYTADLARQAEIQYCRIGRHPGKNTLLKVLSLASRGVAMARWARSKSIDVAVSHGSRGLVVGSALLRIPRVTLFDYEHVSVGLFRTLSTSLLLPEALRAHFSNGEEAGSQLGSIRFYPGYKEEIYLGDFVPDPDEIQELHLPDNALRIILRPPATTAHYYDDRSKAIFQAVLDRISASEDLFGVVLPRTAHQGEEIKKCLKTPSRFRVLDRAVNGLNLIWHADAVVGGGGTMNREAALLGVPVYSVFTGDMGAIDRRLEEEGRMTFLRSSEDVPGVGYSKRDIKIREDLLASLRARSKMLTEILADEILSVAGSSEPPQQMSTRFES